MACVAHDRDLHLRVVWHLVVLTMSSLASPPPIGGHGDLEASAHRLEVFICAHVAVLQARPHRVYIEERVLSVFDVRAGVPV